MPLITTPRSPEPGQDTTGYEPMMLRWIDTAIEEGDAILRDEPMYAEADRNIAYVMGDQIDPKRSKDLSNVNDNMLKDIVLKTVAGLTDIHPLFTFSTFNPSFQGQSVMMDKLTRAWWTTNFVDMQLAEVVKLSAVTGLGYGEVVWRQELGGGAGDIAIIPRDPRDVVPIRPTLSRSVQDWLGVILRTSMSINEVRQRYGRVADSLTPDRGLTTLVDRTWSRAKRFAWPVYGAGTQETTRSSPRNTITRVPSVDVVSVYLKDYSTYHGSTPRFMGEQNTSWGYWVYPKGFIKPDGQPATDADTRLYPRGRLIIAVPGQKVLYDGPNPYWHGMFPVVRLQLDPWPWTMWGGSLVKDLRLLQDALNEVINGILDAVRKALKPGIIADKKSVPESLWQKINTRLAGLRIKQNPIAGKGIQFTEPPNLPQYVMATLEFVVEELEKKAGVANMDALTQLNQIPAMETVEQLQQALSPLLRLKGRLLEGFMRELGEMVKCNFFQFYNMPRRMQYLGEDGITLNDFDYDPGTLIPAMTTGEEGYMADYDINVPRAVRAQSHIKNFTFQIQPNSLLSINQVSRKMLYLQLQRMGLMDRWTLYEVLEIPNGGQPPSGATTITERQQAEMLLGMQMQSEVAQAGLGLGLGIGGGGGGNGGNPGPGRKPSAQEPPQLVQKADQNGIPRQTISESGT